MKLSTIAASVSESFPAVKSGNPGLLVGVIVADIALGMPDNVIVVRLFAQCAKLMTGLDPVAASAMVKYVRNAYRRKDG